MKAINAFIMGGTVTGLALPVLSRVQRRRAADTTDTAGITSAAQLLHLAIQGSPTGITVIDRDGSVVLSNASAHHLGIIQEHTINADLMDVVAQTFADHLTHIIDLKTAKRSRPRSNRISAVQAVVQPLALADDRFVIVYASDESENVRMESARRDFVANVSHELKTPVGSMAVLAEALVESADDPEHVRHFGSRLHSEAHRLADMINELISLSKLQGAERLPDMKPLLVDDVIDQAIQRTQLAADTADIELIHSQPMQVWVEADDSLLVTALVNLIHNAINYSPQSMPVSVVQRVAGDAVFIDVIDHGIGIAAKHQSRVFERFFRVDKARSRQTGGTGLGLAIVKHVMANHGGSVSVYSTPGRGSTFTLELPVYRPTAEMPRLAGRRKDA